MSKVRKSYFQKHWLMTPMFELWLEDVNDDKTKAYCKICKCKLRAHRSDLIKHITSVKHKKNYEFISVSEKNIKLFENCNGISVLEIKLSVYVACHTAIQSIDHLSEIFHKSNEGGTSSSTSETLRLHRTKSSALIKKVISPELLKEQVAEINKSSFSLILDESTDSACCKHLCLCVRYYSEKDNKILSQFLGLVEVVETTADALYKHVKDFFNKTGITLRNCFAIGSDGASILCGKNHSLFTLMKKEIPNLILIKCICHSLHLVISYAYEHLPTSLDYMIRESYNWFHRSSLRKKSFTDLYKSINDGKDPLQLIPLSSTRWLARSDCIKRILNNWDSLKLHFQLASSICDKYLAKELHRMYSDPVNELYLTFVMPILAEFERINLLFQNKHVDHCKLLKELEDFTLTLLRRIIYPRHVNLKVDMNSPNIYLPIEKVDFGYVFLNKLTRKSIIISPESLKDIYHTCHNFLKTSCEQLLNRIPSNYSTLKKINNLSPNICLNPARPPFSDLPLELADQSILDILENQWRQLLNIQWKDAFPSESYIPNDGALFWGQIFNIKDAVGNPVLRDLATFALKLYSLPITNANVERVFSRVTSAKAKLKNRMCLELLDSILRIKMILEERGTCCIDFIPSPQMLHYNSEIYIKTETTEQDDVDQEEAEEIFNTIID